MNRELLKAVRDKIKGEPRQFNMYSFFEEIMFDGFGKIEIPNCKTAACIGGWAISCHYETTPKKTADMIWVMKRDLGVCVSDVACKVLMLTELQGDKLFHVSCWPPDFAIAYGEQSAGTQKAADIACELLDRILRGTIQLSDNGVWTGDLEYTR